MKRTALQILILLVLTATSAFAGTFNATHYLAEPEVDVLNRAVTNDQLGRDLFGSPYATVVIGNVDLYDRFPYIEARYFQLVTDPSWNRILMGEIGKTPAAFDGTGAAFGALASPHGLSSDEANRVYVADTGNDRVLVFQAENEFDRMTLKPLYSIDGLSRPYDVVHSDHGTPFDTSDDRLYIANSGRNEVRLYSVQRDGAQFIQAIGELGSGMGHFAGPLAITVGRNDGANTEDVFVSDAHNGRIVHLIDTGNGLSWQGSVPHTLGPVTSLDTDHWGNVYAASPQAGVVKFTSTLMPVASYTAGVDRPRDLHIPFANVNDHRTGQVTRKGQGSAVVVETWNDNDGLKLLNLGVELTDAAVVEGTQVRMMLTDNADVTATIIDPATGSVIARHDAGVLAAGPQSFRFDATDFVAPWEPREYRMTLSATSTYDTGTVAETTLNFTMGSSGAPSLPEKLTSLGNTPNPFNPTTTIRFVVPNGTAHDYSVRIYDVAGRLVRTLAGSGVSGGLQQVLWDGRSGTDDFVGSGVYLYRVDVGAEKITGKMVMVK